MRIPKRTVLKSGNVLVVEERKLRGVKPEKPYSRVIYSLRGPLKRP